MRMCPPEANQNAQTLLRELLKLEGPVVSHFDMEGAGSLLDNQQIGDVVGRQRRFKCLRCGLAEEEGYRFHCHCDGTPGVTRQ